MTATELAQLEAADELDEVGGFRAESEIQPEISFNGRSRPVYWTNPRVREALEASFSQGCSKPVMMVLIESFY